MCLCLICVALENLQFFRQKIFLNHSFFIRKVSSWSTNNFRSIFKMCREKEKQKRNFLTRKIRKVFYIHDRYICYVIVKKSNDVIISSKLYKNVRFYFQ